MGDTRETAYMPMKMAATIAENPDALRAFGQMSAADQGAFIKKAKGARTPDEMRAIASDIAVFR